MKDIKEIAKWFLSKESMSQKKLQKLCYYYIAWGYVFYNKAMAKNSDFYGFIQGPFSKVLQNEYENYEWEEIDKIENLNITFSKNENELLNFIWNSYGNLSDIELEILTSRETPWVEARYGLDMFEPGNELIDTNTMKAFYSKIYDRYTKRN
ncbi:Panacea domain-containing protein [Metamycoplasma buccale]|uniref:Panacea domain-containing protein n=1 Tax=Metamycoplasma buccale TaxID=55602 RepID=UPI00398F66D4